VRLRVDVKTVLSLVGTVVRWLSFSLIIPLLTALVYGDAVGSFLVTFLVAFGLGFGLEQLEDNPDLSIREAFLMVSLSWLTVAVIGALPYILEGNGSLAHPLNAFFESMSGFTTTGSTVITSFSFDVHSRSLMMWRQLTQWLGGMGIVVLAVAILPKLSVGGTQLIQQEAPGPSLEKLTPRIAETARRLWFLYLGFTVLEIILLWAVHGMGLAPKLNLYQSIAHAFTTMPTGGFSPQARSIEAFSPIAQWIIIPFMIVAGTNFALWWYCFSGSPKKLFRNKEWRFYLLVILSFTVLTAFLLGGSGQLFYNQSLTEVEETVRHSLFQVVSIVTTTGYASVDFSLWHDGVLGVLLFLMFVGGCAGSTGGSIKIVRWLVALKTIMRELFTTIHSAAVRPIRLGEIVLEEDTIRGITIFIFLYFLIFSAGTGLILVDCYLYGVEMSFLETVSASATTIGNVGPGFEDAGPMNNFLVFPPFSRLVMALLMWLGRLELVTVFVLLTPAYWTS
jgi:trk system potassium uptake protein TrkH